MTNRTTRLSTPVFVALMVVAVLLLAEGITRWTGRFALSWCERMGLGFHSPYHTRVSSPWILDSGIRKTFSFAQPEFDHEVRTNSEGVRDVEHPVEKGPDEYRIVALGDSFTMGQGAAFEDSYPRVLERRLNQGAASGRIRVISGGVMGSDPVFCYHLLVRRLLKYRPDLVILLVNDGDVEDLIVRGGRDRFGPDGAVRNPAAPPFYWAFAWSHLARGVMMTFWQTDYYGLRPREREEKNQLALDEILGVARDFQARGEDAGYRFLLALLPHRGQLLDRGGPILLEQLEPLCEQEGIECLDLTDPLRSRLPVERVEEHFWPLDGHFNARGYALLAESIHQRLCERAPALGFPRKDESCP